MALVADTWTGNQDPGDPLDGVANAGYLSALRTGVNSVDNSQIPAGANIDGAKLADATVTNAKLVNLTIQNGKLLWNDATNGIRALATDAPQRKVIRGTKAMTVLAATTYIQATVTFTADGADAPSAFTSATDLNVVATFVNGSGAALVELPTVSIGAITATTVVIGIQLGAAAGANRAFTVHWIAVGRGID